MIKFFLFLALGTGISYGLDIGECVQDPLSSIECAALFSKKKTSHQFTTPNGRDQAKSDDPDRDDRKENSKFHSEESDEKIKKGIEESIEKASNTKTVGPNDPITTDMRNALKIANKSLMKP